MIEKMLNKIVFDFLVDGGSVMCIMYLLGGVMCSICFFVLYWREMIFM